MKNKMIYIVTGVIILAIIAAIVIAVKLDFSQTGYVAKVDGEKISVAEYNYFLYTLKNQWEQSAGAGDPAAIQNFWKTQIEGKNAVDAVKDQAMQEAKAYKIQLIKAKEAKTELTKTDTDDINNYINGIVKQYGDKATAEQKVKDAYDMTLDEYKVIYTNYKIISKFSNSKINAVQPKDADITKYVTDNKKNVERAQVRHILFLTVDSSNNPLPKAQQDAAKKKADDILAKVQAGQDMKTLATQNSEDPAVTTNGGLYELDGNGNYYENGSIQSQLVPEFTTWVFDAKRKVGDTGVITTSYGYHVMKLEKVSTSDEEKANAKKAVQEESYSKELDTWTKDAKYNAVMNKKTYDSANSKFTSKIGV